MTVVRVPGRVNLIGDHTDYHGGFALPMAIDRWCEIEAAPIDAPIGERVVRGTSAQFDGTVTVPLDAPASVEVDPRTVEPAWGRFVVGAVAALQEAGVRVAGTDLAISSTVAAGAGLSSSSALAVALTLALGPDRRADVVARAELARDAEQRATGVGIGLMDQLTALAGRAGHALLIDFDTLTMEPVPLPDELAVLVVHSGQARSLAGSAYASRRADGEAVAAQLGLASLRDATIDQVARSPRARHVVRENERVLAAVDALRVGDLRRVGELMLASHASLRDDYEVSTPELDSLVNALMRSGAWGARLTGAGFGGCVVAIASVRDARDVLADATAAYGAATGITASGFVARSVDGALTRTGDIHTGDA